MLLHEVVRRLCLWRLVRRLVRRLRVVVVLLLVVMGVVGVRGGCVVAGGRGCCRGCRRLGGGVHGHCGHGCGRGGVRCVCK